MKRNNLGTLAFAACTLLLSACSNEWSTTDNPNHAGAGEAIVQVSLQFPQADKPGGYAVGEGDVGDVDGKVPDNKPEGVALDAEKEIKSIAFIAFTADGPGIYLSTNDALTPQGFTEPLTAVEGKKGEYKAAFKIKSNNFEGETTIVAIANFFEHGLKDAIEAPELTKEGLKAMLSDALVAGNSIEYPLLMTMAITLPITEGTTITAKECPFIMERIMARVDVVNNAYDKDDTNSDKNFKLTSARLLNAPTHGTMIGGQTNANPAIAYVNTKPYTKVDEILPANDETVTPTNPAKQQLEPMYVYENKNTTKVDVEGKPTDQPGATATSIEVTGTYQGKTYTKVIPFMTAKTPENLTGTIVPIARNTRYVVEITRTTETDLAFGVKVTDWTDGEKLDVGIDFAPPTLEGLEITPGTGATLTADAGGIRTINITNATAPTELTFTANGFQDTDITLEKEYDENTTKVKDGIEVGRGDLSGYAGNARATPEVGPLHREYTITIPKFTGEYPSNTKIVVYNSAYAGANTVINVRYAPFFIGDFQSEAAASINPVTRLIDLKGVPSSTAGSVTFFASANTALDDATIINKGLTNPFYTITTAAEKQTEVLTKYGPGKRVTVSYPALSDNPELAEVSVKETGADATTAKKLYVKCFKKAYFESMKLSLNKENALADVNDDKKIYLAVNNGDHGTIDYTVYDDVAKNTFTPAATATYVISTNNPSWLQDGMTSATVGDPLEVVSKEFQIVKRVIKVLLPTVIEKPCKATFLKVGMLGEPEKSGFSLTPVYLAGTTITADDRDFTPVCAQGVWWAPINIGQKKISTVGNPSAAAGYIFQWGRKRALTFDSKIVSGPFAPGAPEVAQDKFITTADAKPYDWCNPQNDGLWNSGTEDDPTKVVANDPCPVGWRVPTETEWRNSIVGTSGVWAPGGVSADSNGLFSVRGDGAVRLFFSAAGYRDNNGKLYGQGMGGYYWASTPSNYKGLAWYVSCGGTSMAEDCKDRACGMNVRCVQALK